MHSELDRVRGGKSAGDLAREAFWFSLYCVLAVALLASVVLVFSLLHVSAEDNGPKLLATVLALVVPLAGGFLVGKVQGNPVAHYVWLAGLVFFCLVCVWVLDLPTGPGLCENCGAVSKLYRTFFDINHGSGLMGGDGLLVGTWVPLSLIGFAIGARFGIRE